MIGIYKIQSKIDNKCYIGSSINIYKRWIEHKYELKNNRHPNSHLQNFVNKYGLESLEFEILEECSKDNILFREQLYLDSLEINNEFNICLSSSAPMTNRKHSEETLKRMSISQSKENNPIYGTKRPQHVIDAIVKGRKLKRFSTNEKIKRLINLPNRIEVTINKNDTIIRCFSISHAATIIGVSHQSVRSAIKRNRKTKGWKIIIHEDRIYNQIDSKLIQILKNLN